MENTAGFGVNQSLIPYNETDSYARVFLVGLLNTLLVSGLGIVFATVLGFVIGIARLSPNWLIARLAGAYVEFIRNLPLCSRSCSGISRCSARCRDRARAFRCSARSF